MMTNERQKFLEIVEKYNLPQPVEDITGKTVDYVIDDHEIYIIVFTDNTCYFMWTNSWSEGIRIESDYDDIFTEFDCGVLETLKEKYPQAKEEWNEYARELKKQDDELKREYRYQEYLKLKKEFEGKGEI